MNEPKQATEQGEQMIPLSAVRPLLRAIRDAVLADAPLPPRVISGYDEAARVAGEMVVHQLH